MKTIETIKNQIAANVEDYRNTKTMREARDTLETLYRESVEGKPSDTIAAFVAAVGYDLAVVVVASLVNHSAWDGRIYPSVKAWAASVPDAYDEEAADRLSLHTSIHKAHLNQLGEAMSRYQPEEPTPEEDTATATQEAAQTDEATEDTTHTESGDEAATETKGESPMFENIKNAIEAEAAKKTADTLHFIRYGFMPSWAEEHRTNADRGLEQYSTAARWNAYKAGRLTRDKAVEYASKRAAAEVERWRATQLSKLHAAEAAPALNFVSISVEWKRSSTWGANPTATTGSNYTTATGKASGCGYDKESAAIAEALNQDPAVMRELYALADQALAEGVSYREFIGYGSGYNIVPYFEGGVGSSCFWSIFKRMGFTVRCAGSGKMFDCYTVEKEVA